VITSDPALLAAAAALRVEVFVDEQGVEVEVEADGADAGALHSVMVEHGAVVATGRLVEEPPAAGQERIGPSGRLGRIAVRADRRGGGLGALVVTDLVRAAATAGLPRLRLHSQAEVVGFYERLGWHAVGEPDVEAGIAHRWMARDLLPGLRPVTDADAAGLQTLVAGCFAAYEGAVLELDGLDAWMHRPASELAAKGAQVWVVPGAGASLAASGGWQPAGDRLEVKTMYTSVLHRRKGYAAALLGLVLRAGREQGKQVELWTDTRFTDAHRLYERAGFRRLPGSRQLHDLSGTTEHHYLLDQTV
jgi:predicted GNAT family N-acyltransferase